MAIRYLKHNQIDKRKWNNCIKCSFNGIVYAYSWYLDIVSENWDALVEDDYISVMPLTKKVKYGVNYLYQPSFTQQLGVFSSQRLDVDLVDKFINAIPSHFKFIDINLNIFNKIKTGNYEPKRNLNYELDLIEPYQKIRKNYSTNTKRNIQKANRNKICISESVPSHQLISLFKDNVGNPRNNFDDAHYDTLRRLIAISTRYRIGETLGAYTSENNLCAASYFVYSNQRGIYLVSASTPEGLEKRAMFKLVDYYIQRNSERTMTLDFEGSNIEGIARFFKGFGASLCEYYTIKINRLPWPVRWIKS